jgi:hypothetical protein
MAHQPCIHTWLICTYTWWARSASGPKTRGGEGERCSRNAWGTFGAPYVYVYMCMYISIYLYLSIYLIYLSIYLSSGKNESGMSRAMSSRESEFVSLCLCVCVSVSV